MFIFWNVDWISRRPLGVCLPHSHSTPSQVRHSRRCSRLGNIFRTLTNIFEKNWMFYCRVNIFYRSMSFIFGLNYRSWTRRISHVNLVLLLQWPTVPCPQWMLLSACPSVFDDGKQLSMNIGNWDIMKSVVKTLYLCLSPHFLQFSDKAVLVRTQWIRVCCRVFCVGMIGR